MIGRIITDSLFNLMLPKYKFLHKHFIYLCAVVRDIETFLHMNVHQFYDEGLAHAAYAITSGGTIALIDPGRDPRPYLDFADKHGARIAVIIETHPHADFVSSHAELHRLTGAVIYTSRLTGAEYPHRTFDDGDLIPLGDVQLKALGTPGHSPDSISVLLMDERNEPYAVFTGDTLFVGDVGRPDLRENVGNVTAKAEALARQLYHSLRGKLMVLPGHVLVYPAHGPGSLCGKNMGSDLFSTIEREAAGNYALQALSEDRFVNLLLDQQPFVPAYFEYAVTLNKRGADDLEASIAAIPMLGDPLDRLAGIPVVDTRSQEQFKAGHLPEALNIPDGLRFETWLGTIIHPREPFYLMAETEAQLELVIRKAAKIGYEQQVKAKAVIQGGPTASPLFDMTRFVDDMDGYTIVDIRNRGEAAANPIFDKALNIPLPELRANVSRIPSGKPIAVHCAGGYRSAIGSSLLAAALPEADVLDISNRILDFTPAS